MKMAKILPHPLSIQPMIKKKNFLSRIQEKMNEPKGKSRNKSHPYAIKKKFQ
jgi:hypothetical protein